MESSINKTICIAGGNGFVGQALSKFLQQSGFTVLVLPRTLYQHDVQALADRIDGCHAVINLAGASIGKRWTRSYRAEILNSRLVSTNSICKAMSLCNQPPVRFISTSAVGIYDTIHQHSEDSIFFANDFLSDVCKRWELAADAAPDSVQKSIVRLGVVLGKEGGTLKKLLPLFRAGLGGRMGSGKQAFSFIHIHDICKAILHILSQQNSKEIYNLVAPQIISNKEFTRALAHALHRPAWLFVPAFILKFMLGKSADVILKGQQVIPANLLKEGFVFDFPDIHQQGFFL